VILEVTSIVWGVGTEVDCEVLDAEWDTDDGGGCGGSVAVIGRDSAFTRGVVLVSGCAS